MIADVLTINRKFVISASKRFAVTTLIPCEIPIPSSNPITREITPISSVSITRIFATCVFPIPSVK